MRVDEGADSLCLRDAWEQPIEVRQEPVPVDAGVPVEAPVEDRVERARPMEIGVAAEDVVGLVRVLVRHVTKRDARQRAATELGQSKAHGAQRSAKTRRLAEALASEADLR